MRLRLVATVMLALAAPALADDYTITWHEVAHAPKGDRTVDSTLRVTGAKILYTSTYEGPEPDKPRNKPQKTEGKVVADKLVDDALAALAKIKPTPEAKIDPKIDHSIACFTRKGKKRCESWRGDTDPPTKTPGYTAIENLTTLLFEGVPRPK